MADSFEDARAVQAKLNARYGSESWFCGIGIGKGRASQTFAVEVLVSDEAEARKLPTSLDGIEVRSVSAGNIRAL